MSDYQPDDELLLAVRAARPAVPEEVISPDRVAGRATLERVLASRQEPWRAERGRRRYRAARWPGSRFSLRTAVAGLPVLFAVIVAVLVAVVALTAFKPHPRSSAAAGTAAESRSQLVDAVGVLRRPQTNADRNPKVLKEVASELTDAPGSTIDLPLVRYATTTPWGEKLYFVPVTPQKRRLAFPRFLAGERLFLATSNRFGGSVGYNLAGIESGEVGASEPAGRRVLGGGSSEVRFIFVVPDRVERVALVLPRDALPGVPFEPVYPHPLSVTAPVHDNIVAVQIDRQFDRSNPAMIWYAADGSVIKRIGNFGDLNRVVPEPLPGPETPQSRAVETDPSTPNLVWITPAVGGPQTRFAFHFHVLLNEAEYVPRLSGPSCPGRHLYSVNYGAQPQSENLRGRVYTETFANPSTGWCPGTYHLSVTLISEAFSQPFKPPAKPFGTASFTVRPGPTKSSPPVVGNAVVNDCLSHGRLTHPYTNDQLSHALAAMPSKIKQYTDCSDVVKHALLGKPGR